MIVKLIMNLYKFVSVIRKRPGIYFGRSKISSVKDIGFFIRFLCAEESADQNDDFDTFFKEKFGKFVREKFEVELTEFEFWFETIEKKLKRMKQQ